MILTPDEIPWWAQHDSLVLMVDYLAEEGWTGKEIADVVRKPWAFEDEYWAATTEAAGR